MTLNNTCIIPAKYRWYLPCFPRKQDSNTLYLFFLVLPLMDSLNGCLNKGGNWGFLSLGIVYRMALILYCLLFLLRSGIQKRTILVLSACACLIILPHLFDFLDENFLSLTVKTVLPILCIEVFISKCSSGDISEKWFETLLNAWCVLFPLTIIVPYLFGFGFQTYGSGSVGYKGFYYAQNDLCFVLSLLFFFSCGRIVKKISFSNVIKLISLAFCIILLGMKSGYLLLAVSIFYWLLKGDFSSKSKAVLIGAIMLLGLLFFGLSADSINSVFERWIYFWKKSENFLMFLSSGRIGRIPQVAFSLANSDISPFWILFGSGTVYSDFVYPFGLIEMDPFDLFFQYGLIGITFFSVYYGSFLTCRLPKNKKYYRFALVMSLIMSLLAGHVLNSALSSMVFAVLCSSAWSVKSTDDCVSKNV